LFVELERHLPPERGPTACMRSEHEQGRWVARDGARMKAGDGRRSPTPRGNVTLLREHIDKEDHVLFPMAKSMLDHDAVQRLRAGFERVEHVDMGEGAHLRYEELARRLVADQDVAGKR
jgi:hemerythrin-like domain-containing protein